MEKIWVIPDIHGCVNTLKQLIENGIQPSKEDKIYFLGDYIDRGPDGKGVIDYIMSLQESGYKVDYLIGNHEYYCMNSFEKDQHRFLFKSNIQKEWERYGAKATLASFGVRHPRDIDPKYIEWMKKGKYFIELDKFILVHAGMNFNIQDPFDDTMSMLWVRDFKVDTSKIGGKKIIHGHVPVEHSLIQLFLDSGGYDFIALDNGVYYRDQKVGFGNLMALELNNMELIAQPNVDF